MISFSSNFWPAFLAIIGSGAALTTVLSALAALGPRRSASTLRPATVVPTAGPYRADDNLPTAA
jgi:hypothetical protein